MKTEGVLNNKNNSIVLFDGICNLCQKSVQFIIKHDPKAEFQFAAFQSVFGKTIQKTHNFSEKIESLILIENGLLFDKSSAALKIARRLNGLWPVFYVFIIIPKPVRDFIYDIIARNRYKIFGKNDHCKITDEEHGQRFLL